MQRACIYQLIDRTLVSPESRTNTGLWVSAEPYVVLPKVTEAEALGNAINEALSKSNQAISAPSDWSVFKKPRLSAAGVRSESEFQSSSRLVAVGKTDSSYAVQPHHNGGTKGEKKGFQELSDSVITLSHNAPSREIGAALLEAFTKCTTAT